jgi:hypothetical protein
MFENRVMSYGGGSGSMSLYWQERRQELLHTHGKVNKIV